MGEVPMSAEPPTRYLDAVKASGSRYVSAVKHWITMAIREVKRLGGGCGSVAAAAAVPPTAHAGKPPGPRVELLADAFDCPICTFPMVQRIYQCPAGHHVCEGCRERLRASGAMCPTCKCSYPEDDIRNLAMEALASQCSFPCKYGCGVVARPDELQGHLPTCTRRPVPCIVRGCRHECPAQDLLEHLLSGTHKDEIQVSTETPAPGSATVLVLQCGQMNVPTDWTTYWQGSRRWPMIQLINAKAGWLCIMDRCTKDGMFTAKACHFDAPLRYTFEVLDNDGRSLTLSGLTSHVSEATTVEGNIIVPGRLAGRCLSEAHHNGMRLLPMAIRVRAA